MTWFTEARLGMFVHWSHCSQAGRELSWPLVGGIPLLPYSGPVPVAEYHATAATFAPRPGSATQWTDLARQAGMGYAVMTARHHDGFSMFHTKHSTFSIEHAPYGGDLVREYVDACRVAGLRVGLYYSLSDWHHPDYPAFTDGDRPYLFTAYRRPEPDAWRRYLDYLFGQVEELLTHYGAIDVLWFDGGWERSPEEWRADELHDLIKSLPPDVMVNDRLPGFGDFETPEQIVPAHAPTRPCDVIISVPEEVIDPMATVIEVTISGPPDRAT